MILLSKKQISAHPDVIRLRLPMPIKISVYPLDYESSWIEIRKVAEGAWIITDFEPSTLTLQEVMEAIERLPEERK